MIDIYEGRLGGGKTYASVVRMVEHLARGGTVCTNVELFVDKIAEYVANLWRVIIEPSQVICLTDSQIAEFHRHTPSGTKELPVLVVIDEAHLVFNARDWAKTSKETLSFLTQSRKVATDVIFISQSALNIDKQFMRLVQFIWRFRDLSSWKIPGLGCKYPFQHLMVSQFDYDGRTRLNRFVRTKDVRIFALYNTNSLLRDFPRLEGVSTKRELKKTERQKTPMWKILLVILAVAGVCMFFLWDRFSKIGKAETPAPAAPVRQFTPIEEKRVDKQAQADSHRAETHASTNEKKKEPDNLYDLYDEQFRSWNGYDSTLTTDVGVYAVGEMSNRGFVIAVRSGAAKVARVVQPNGRAGWVVAREKVTEIKGEAQSETRREITPPPEARPVVPAPAPAPAPAPEAATVSTEEKKNVLTAQRPKFRGIDIRKWPQQLK